MNKLIGYLFMILGVAGLAMMLESVKKMLNIGFISSMSNMTLTIISVVLIVLGIIVTLRSPARTEAEVPIYEGKNVVGYRRN